MSKRAQVILHIYLFLLLLFAAGTQTALASCWINPIMQGQDPQLEFKDGYFHLVQSDGCKIYLRHSTTFAGLATASALNILSPGCSNVWAPEIHWISNKWYVYYSLGSPDHPYHRVYAAESQGTSVFGPYTIRGILYDGFWNIDGSVFTGTNGQLYFVFSGSPTDVAQNIYIASMSNPYTLSGPPVLISQPVQSWETVGSPPPVNEGPFGFTRNGRTFIVYSASGCWTDNYCLGLLTLTGTNLMDPNSWTKSGPVFSQQSGAYGPGHNAVFTDANGQWWNVYHANNLAGQGCGGNRQIRVQRMFWDAGGMPVFGSPVPVGSWVSDDTNFLVAQFLLNETSGSFAANQTCSPSGVLMGSPLWMNPGLKLNGTNDYVDCGAATGNDVQTALTLSAWIRPDAFIDWAGIITKGTNTSPYAMQIWSDGSLRFSANWGNPGGGTGSGSWNSAAKLTLGQWQHVAVTYDGATIRFYINGQLDAYQPAASLRFGVVNESLTLGADLPGGDEYFKGTIRDVRIYGRALSGTEILNMVNRPPVFTTNPGSVAVLAGTILTVTNAASDPDLPPQTLTWSLLSPPAGASIGTGNGVFTWRPAMIQSPSTNTISVRVADNGTPVMSATQNFTVTVQRPASPTLASPNVYNGNFALLINGVSGPDYVLESSTNLTDAIAWRPLTTNLSAITPFWWTNPVTRDDTQEFYRVRLAP